MANFTLPFLLLLLLVLPSFPPLLAFVWCLKNMDALLEVKKSLTEDPYRVLKHWIVDNSEFCSWTGVTCDLGSSMVGLNLSAALLAGLVLPAFGWLALLPPNPSARQQPGHLLIDSGLARRLRGMDPAVLVGGEGAAIGGEDDEPNRAGGVVGREGVEEAEGGKVVDGDLGS